MENLRYNDTMNEEKRKVAVIGALNVDISGRAEAPLAGGDSIPGKVRTTLGGVGWNIARNCSLLGADTAFYSLLGRDEHESVIRAESGRYVVDISGCRWTDEPNNRYLYICDEHGDVAACVNDMALCARMDRAFVSGFLGDLSGSFDFIFLDAAKGQYIVWLPELLRLLAPGGLLMSDNVLQDGTIVESRYAVERRDRTIHARMREYLYTLKHTPGLVTSVLPVGDGVALSVKTAGAGQAGAPAVEGNSK